MTSSAISRRTLMNRGGAALAGLSVLRVAGPTAAFQTPATGEVIPWLDQPEPNPVPEVIVQQLDWEQLESWLTPTDDFFVIKHFDQPELDEGDWRLEIGGLVDQPMTLTLDDLKARARQEVTFTMECSGNTGLPFFNGGIGNATWAGRRWRRSWRRRGCRRPASRSSSGARTRASRSGAEMTITEQFARSMSLADALHPDNLLVYEMNGEPLPAPHGFPLRLIAPGWYGIANVKWLTRIEVLDRRYQGHFMARDYVTIREEERDGETVWTFTSVTRDRLKSAPAKVTQAGRPVQHHGCGLGGTDCRGRGPHR